MVKVLSILVALVAILHGLIHLMGWVAYWPLREVSELPYKTNLLGGRWEVGAQGMRLYSILWLLAALCFVLAGALLLLNKPAWAPVMLAATLLSLLLCILDWGAAFRGAIINLVLLVVLGVVFGLRHQPQAFRAYTAPAVPVTTAPLPGNLPAPVARYFRLLHGDGVPKYTSAVMSGRGTIRFMGVVMPARLRFIHASGQGYRHYIEATFWGYPVFKVNERYLDGKGWMQLPFGVVENDPGVDSAANQGLWAETFIYPAYLVTDPRVRWEAVDADTAKMFVPYGEGEQEFTVEFDPQTGMLKRYETLRYRDEKLGMIRWWGDFAYEPDLNGDPVLSTISATWEDEGTPWLIARMEEKVFNSDVSQYVQGTGL
jgi:hypothetical protein